MSTKDPTGRRSRRWLPSAAVLLLAVTAGTVAATTGPAAPAAAHTINASDFQQVELARGVNEMGEPMSLAVLPDRSVLHTARNGTVRRTDAAGATRVVGTIPVYTHDEEGLQSLGVDPGFATNRFIYLYYAPPLSTPAGDAPATGTDCASAVAGRQPAVPLHAERRLHAQPGQQGRRAGRRDRPGHLLPRRRRHGLRRRRATSTCPPATTATRSTPPATRRSTNGPTATRRYDAQRGAGNTNDLRGKLLRIKVERRRVVLHPEREPVRPGHREDPSRDLRDGLPQPVPDQRRQGHRHRLRRRLRPGRRQHQRQPGPGRPGRVQPDHRPGQLRLAVLHRHQHHGRDVQRVELRHQLHRRRSSTAPAGRPTTRSATPASAPSRRPSPPGSGTAATPAARRRSAAAPSPRWPARSTATTPTTPRRRSSRRPSTGSSSPASSAAAGSSRSTSTPTASPGTIDSFPWAGKQVMDLAFGPDGALLRAGLRHRLLQRRRQLGPVPLRLRRRRQPGAGRRAPAPTGPPVPRR